MAVSSCVKSRENAPCSDGAAPVNGLRSFVAGALTVGRAAGLAKGTPVRCPAGRCRCGASRRPRRGWRCWRNRRPALAKVGLGIPPPPRHRVFWLETGFQRSVLGETALILPGAAAFVGFPTPALPPSPRTVYRRELPSIQLTLVQMKCPFPPLGPLRILSLKLPFLSGIHSDKWKKIKYNFLIKGCIDFFPS